MKKLFFAIPLSFLIACGGGESVDSNKEIKEDANAVATACTFTVSDKNPTVLWEAYKFTERAAVGGKMDSVVFSGLDTAASAGEVFANAEFKVFTSGVNSNNPDRDAKIAKSFFGVLEMPSLITGKVESVTEGKINVWISMNGVDKLVTLDTEMLSETRYKASGTIDVTAFNAEKAVASLNKVCEELHKGADGSSKLWPDFKISLVADLNRICD